LFIVLEGLDRSGKTTQRALLVEHLLSLGVGVAEGDFVKVPNRSTQTGVLLDRYLRSLDQPLPDEAVHLLFSANRWEDTRRLQGALREGLAVVLDRYIFSGVAYSHAKHLLDPSSTLTWDWCCASDRGLPLPDLVLYLDVSPGLQVSRGGFGEERYEQAEFQAAVREAFSKWDLGDRWQVINADGTVEEVHESIVRAVGRVMSRPRGELEKF
jgi:dTMP kinase